MYLKALWSYREHPALGQFGFDFLPGVREFELLDGCMPPTYLILGADLDLQVQIYYRLLDLVVVSGCAPGAHATAARASVVRRIDLVRIASAASSLARPAIGTATVRAR